MLVNFAAARPVNKKKKRKKEVNAQPVCPNREQQSGRKHSLHLLLFKTNRTEQCFHFFYCTTCSDGVPAVIVQRKPNQ